VSNLDLSAQAVIAKDIGERKYDPEEFKDHVRVHITYWLLGLLCILAISGRGLSYLAPQ